MMYGGGTKSHCILSICFCYDFLFTVFYFLSRLSCQISVMTDLLRGTVEACIWYEVDGCFYFLTFVVIKAEAGRPLLVALHFYSPIPSAVSSDCAGHEMYTTTVCLQMYRIASSNILEFLAIK